jgi:hypothetical protein
MNPADCVIQNHSIPAELLAPLRETTFGEADGELLRDRLRDDGYLFLRGALKVDDVLAARRTVFERLAAVGEISEPAIDGIFTETSRRKELAGDLGRFWQSVSEEPRLRVVSHGEQTRRIMTAVLGEPARPHDYLFLRPGVPGRASYTTTTRSSPAAHSGSSPSGRRWAKSPSATARWSSWKARTVSTISSNRSARSTMNQVRRPACS